MLPDEPVSNGESSELWGHLVEARSIGGLSGSPVFVKQTIALPEAMPEGGTPDGHPISPFASGPLYLLGLAQGHWDIKADRLNEQVTQTTQDGGVNLGIAIVVPIEKIVEILNEAPLVAARKESERRSGTAKSD